MTLPTDNDRKPLGIKNYGSIPHLPNSRIGPGDHSCSEGQARIATQKTRDQFDRVIIQEKLDGSNVGIARIGESVIAITRAGYLAHTSPYKQHHVFGEWVSDNAERFLNVLEDGERLVGEWLLQAHGTRYYLTREPFVAFDIMRGDRRLVFSDFHDRIGMSFNIPASAIYQSAVSIHDAEIFYGQYGFYGAADPIEGYVWRVERNEVVGKGKREWRVDFLVKYVKPDKVDGKYLPEISVNPPVYNSFAELESWKERFKLE